MHPKLKIPHRLSQYICIGSTPSRASLTRHIYSTQPSRVCVYICIYILRAGSLSQGREDLVIDRAVRIYTQCISAGSHVRERLHKSTTRIYIDIRRSAVGNYNFIFDSSKYNRAYCMFTRLDSLCFLTLDKYKAFRILSRFTSRNRLCLYIRPSARLYFFFLFFFFSTGNFVGQHEK